MSLPEALQLEGAESGFLILLVGNRPAGGVQPGGNLIQSSKQPCLLINPSVQCLLMSSL